MVTCLVSGDTYLGVPGIWTTLVVVIGTAPPRARRFLIVVEVINILFDNTAAVGALTFLFAVAALTLITIERVVAARARRTILIAVTITITVSLTISVTVSISVSISVPVPIPVPMKIMSV
jgi:hypothetical protein